MPRESQSKLSCLQKPKQLADNPGLIKLLSAERPVLLMCASHNDGTVPGVLVVSSVCPCSEQHLPSSASKSSSISGTCSPSSPGSFVEAALFIFLFFGELSSFAPSFLPRFGPIRSKGLRLSVEMHFRGENEESLLFTIQFQCFRSQI